MGTRGPIPTPTRILQLRGTFRQHRHGEAAESEQRVQPLNVLPPAPGFLDQVGAYEWERVGRDLVAKEVLTELDLAAFTLYCINVARVVACEKILSEKGMTVATPQGFEQARPEVAIARQCGAEARRFAQEFGLTPSARTRVKTPEKTKPKKTGGWDDV